MQTLLIAIFVIHVAVTALYEYRAKADSSKKENLHRALDTLLVMIGAGLVAFAPYVTELSAVFGVIAVGSIAMMIRGAPHLSRLSRLNALACVVRPLTLLTLLVLWPFINGVSLFMGLVLPFSTDGLKNIGIGYFASLCVLLAFQFLFRRRSAVQPVQETQSTQNAA